MPSMLRNLRSTNLVLLLLAAPHILVTAASASSSSSNNGVAEIEIHGPQLAGDASSSFASPTSEQQFNSTATQDDSSRFNHGRALMDWIHNTESAFFHPGLEIRPLLTGSSIARNTTSTFYSMVATQPIAANELLMEIPPSMILRTGPPKVGDRVVVSFSDGGQADGGEYPGIVAAVRSDGTYDVLCDGDDVEETKIDLDAIVHEESPINCATVRMLANELRNFREVDEAPSSSAYAPYIRYLRSLPTGQLPSAWSKKGRSLLQQVLGTDEDGDPILPPAHTFGWIQDDWYTRCQTSHRLNQHTDNGRDDNDRWDEIAYMLVNQRSWDDVLIPVMDMLSHRNGRWLNTDTDESIHNNDDDDEPHSIRLRATKDIAPGDEIYTSYNFCRDCGGRAHNYGTPEILRDYGFVESYPRRFVFPDQDVIFNVDLLYDDTDIGTSSGEKRVVVEWAGSLPTPKALDFLRQQIGRLTELYDSVLMDPNLSVPPNELEVVTQYVEALVTGMTAALDNVELGDNDHDACVLGSGTSSSNTVRRYPKLETRPEWWAEFRPVTCDWNKEFAYSEWENVASYQTPYQKMEFDINPTMNNDMCFDLDSVVQMCASYRPQYHEMFVHYTARFLDEVKRILFVGGGDSMLLHEALKYPSLELVVGLELDQMVVRKSFQYFGTQPHWDNDKVEWWFGDATKSLLMLPKEYFGSFDLVLVDLSETVMALSVTDELDVLEALSLLVKPNGILVQNEYDHFLEQTHIFRDALMIHYYGVPVVCSQSLVLASNGVDFLRGPYTQHKVDTLLPLLDERNVRYDIIRDYQKNTTNPHHCDKYTPGSADKAVAQGRSPGVIMIAEAENVKVDLTSTETTKTLIQRTLTEQGLTLVSSTLSESSDSTTYTIVLEEGYVVARTMPKHKYVAFDLHFWSHFHRQDVTCKALIDAVGSDIRGQSSSAFRIVAGGMFGTDHWQDEESRLGPHLEDFCSDSPINPSTTTSSPKKTNKVDDFHELVLKESLDVLMVSGYTVAVLCGPKDKECQGVEWLEKHPNVNQVVRISACSSISNEMAAMDSEEKSERMRVCEEEIWQALDDATTDDVKIRALVLDPSAPYPLARIVTRIFKIKSNKELFLTDDVLAQATIADGASWRNVFIDNFRQGVFGEEPVYRAELQVNSTIIDGIPSSIDVVLASSGSRLFPKMVSKMADKIDKSTSGVYQVEIRSIRAGNFLYEDDFVAQATFAHDSYELSDQTLQWKEQLPLGLQTVFQMEVDDDNDPPRKGKHLSCPQLKQALSQTIALMVDKDEIIQSLDPAPGILGDGCALVRLWSTGSVVLLWDGRTHVDMNLFLLASHGGDAAVVDKEDDEDEVRDPVVLLSDQFQTEFASRLSSSSTTTTLETKLRDQFPRGTGRVISYPKPHHDPHWLL